MINDLEMNTSAPLRQEIVYCLLDLGSVDNSFNISGYDNFAITLAFYVLMHTPLVLDN